MCRSKAFGVIVFFLMTLPAIGQEGMNSAIVESKSLQLFTSKNWDDLIGFGKQAVRDGYDYFYLRLRLGIAYYEKGEYRTATTHFQKAIQFNSTDALAQEYLYYSLLFSGRTDDAKKSSVAFSDDVAAKTKINEWPAINYASVEAGTKIASSTLFNNASYFQVGFGHSIMNRVSLQHAITSYTQQESRGKISQRQYFLQANVPLGRNWLLSPSIHLIDLDFETGGTNYPYNNFIGSFLVTKTFSKFDIAVGAGRSNVLSRTQNIQQTTLSVYPFGKPSLMVGATSYVHAIKGGQANVAFNPFVYWKPLPKIGLYANYFMNKNENVIEMNGALVNNSVDQTVSRAMGIVTFHAAPRWDVYGIYQIENKQDDSLFKYSYNVFLVGLKFKPL